jgi:hypothetical protein
MKKYWEVEAKFQANYFLYSWISVIQRTHSVIFFLVLITTLVLKLRRWGGLVMGKCGLHISKSELKEKNL